MNSMPRYEDLKIQALMEEYIRVMNQLLDYRTQLTLAREELNITKLELEELKERHVDGSVPPEEG